MAKHDYVAGVITEFCLALGIDGATLDASGQLTLRLGDLPLTLSHTTEPTDLLWLQADLGTVRADDSDALGFLLRFGYLNWLQGRLTVALEGEPDGEAQRVIGYNCLAVVQLDAARLRDAVELFASAALALQARLTTRSFETAPTTVSEQPGSMLRV